MSTSAAVRRDMKDWVVSDWSVKLDVRDLGGHLDTTYRAWVVLWLLGSLLSLKLSG